MLQNEDFFHVYCKINADFYTGLDQLLPDERSKLCFILIVKVVETNLSFGFEYAYYTTVCGII